MQAYLWINYLKRHTTIQYDIKVSIAFYLRTLYFLILDGLRLIVLQVLNIDALVG